jgi:serine/threonine-protein kinase
MSDVSARRWGELKDAFAALVDMPMNEREHRLASLARTDPMLHAEVVNLLTADARADEVLRDVAGPPADDALPRLPSDPFGLTGTTISHFRVLDVLGCGGMGVVYRAEDVRLGRTVALKFLLRQLSFDASAKERFLKEARAASALDHPNVCTLYEAGQAENGRLFLAMACYEGDTLKARLADGAALDIAEAIGIALQTLRGLASAHRAGIVHRDLKPGNLMLGTDGTARILDFGLARARDDLDLTAPGLPPGTVRYMSPEQLGGGRVDQRTDLWSFGVVLHEMLTGCSPFRRGHDLSTMHSILHDTPPPMSQQRADIPPALDAVVERLLRKEPDERYTTADDVIADLTTASAGGLIAGTQGVRRSLRHRHRRVLRVAAALLVLAAGVGGAVAAARGSGSAPTAVGADAGSNDAGAGVDGGANGSVPANSIAVLTFADLSASDADEYYSDGIAEEILTALHRVRELRVTSRTSAFSFRDTYLPPREIASLLGVRTLLGGSVRRTGDRVRVTAWIIDAPSDREVWSRSFEGTVTDIAAVQTEIARAVVAAVEVQLDANHEVVVPRATLSHTAHESYLHGLFHWHRRTPADVHEAIRYFDEAIRLDPAYAKAYAGLTLAHAVLPILTGTDAAAAVPLVEAAAARALALDTSLADPYAALGYVYHQQWRWADAERAFSRALELDPRHNTALQWSGEHSAKMGRAADAERLLRRAVALDPLSVIAHTNLGLVLRLGGRSADAIAQFEHVATIDPGFAIAYLFLFRERLMTRDLAGAIEAGRTWATLSGRDDPDELETAARAVLGGGSRSDAIAVLDRWKESNFHLVDLLIVAVMLGETERALDALERGLDQRNPMMSSIRAMYSLGPLRNEPRFQHVLQQMRFP